MDTEALEACADAQVLWQDFHSEVRAFVRRRVDSDAAADDVWVRGARIHHVKDGELQSEGLLRLEPGRYLVRVAVFDPEQAALARGSTCTGDRQRRLVVNPRTTTGEQ